MAAQQQNGQPAPKPKLRAATLPVNATPAALPERPQPDKVHHDAPWASYPLVAGRCGACGGAVRMTPGGEACAEGHGGFVVPADSEAAPPSAQQPPDALVAALRAELDALKKKMAKSRETWIASTAASAAASEELSRVAAERKARIAELEAQLAAKPQPPPPLTLEQYAYVGFMLARDEPKRFAEYLEVGAETIDFLRLPR